MRISRPDAERLVISELDRLLTKLLRLISPSAYLGGSPAVDHRFFPSPTGGQERDLEEDWREYVRPELEEHFSSNLQVVEEDLAAIQISDGGDTATLTIPHDHFESWILALNQARIALATRRDAAEPLPELLEDAPPEAVHRLQMYVYDFLLETLLAELDD